MGSKLQRAAVRRRSSKLTRDPELGKERGGVEEMGQKEVETAMHKMKKARR